MSSRVTIAANHGDTITVGEDYDVFEIAIHEETPIGSVFLDRDAARAVYEALGARLGEVPRAATKWEEIAVDPKGAGHTYRLPVEGGHLYRTVSYTVLGEVAAQSTTFVPSVER